MLQSIIGRRRHALIQAWVGNPNIQVQAESPQVLPGLVFLSDPDSGQVSGIGRRALKNCAVVKGIGNRHATWSVWVAAGYASYRSAFLAFVRETYGIAANTSDLTGYDVDHLLNRARSPLGSTFIRLEAVPAVANQAWGRLFEKAASEPTFFANQNRQRRTMNWMICAKLAGQQPPNGPHDEAGIARLVAFFRTLGLSDGDSETGLRNMLNFAYRTH